MNETIPNSDLLSADDSTKGTDLMMNLSESETSPSLAIKIIDDSSSLLEEKRTQDITKPYRIFFHGDLIHE